MEGAKDGLKLGLKTRAERRGVGDLRGGTGEWRRIRRGVALVSGRVRRTEVLLLCRISDMA